MGVGRRVCFWHDVWCGEVTVGERFPELYRIARDKDALVANYLGVVDGMVHWNPVCEVQDLGGWTS